ncbi:hypothetical protein Tco_0494823 [Tanacetum coccineum]
MFRGTPVISAGFQAKISKFCLSKEHSSLRPFSVMWILWQLSVQVALVEEQGEIRIGALLAVSIAMTVRRHCENVQSLLVA